MADERCEARVRIYQNNALSEDLRSRLTGLVPVNCEISCGNCRFTTSLPYQAEPTFKGGERLLKGEALIALSEGLCKPWRQQVSRRGRKWRLMTDNFAPDALKLDQPNPKPSP